MLQLIAVPRGAKWDVKLHNLPPRSVVELRVQNTMNGKERIIGSEANYEGIAVVPFDDFGQHLAITARVLTESNDDLLHPLHFTAASTAERYVMETSVVPDTPTLAVDHGALSVEREEV